MAIEPAFKKGNRYPYLEGQLQEGGAAVNAESPINAVAVKIRIKPPVGAAKVLTAEWVTKKEGKWRYKPTKADTEVGGALFTEGVYEIEVEVEWEAGVIENIPNEEPKKFEIRKILE